MPDAQPLWWSLKGVERAEAMRTTCDHLERIYAPRRKRALANVQIYEGRKLDGLHPYAYFSNAELSSDDYDRQRINLARSLVATAVAKVAGKQRPKAQFCVSDADWTTKRKSKKLEKFVEAQQLARQGNLQDAWAVGLLAFRDCCVTDWGVLKFSADTLMRCVAIERVLPWELLVDPFEARYGMPRNFFHVYGWDRDQACERFPGHRDAIMAAPSLEEENVAVDASGSVYGSGKETSRMVKVREGWRMRFSADKPGVHDIVVGNVSVLPDEEWDRDFPPFELMVWEPWMVGIHGSSLIDGVANLCVELNAAMERWATAEKLCSNGVFIYTKGTVDETSLENNGIGIAIPVEPGATIPPTYTAPNVVSETSVQWIQFIRSMGFETSGVSQQSATSQKDPGVTAGVAMRTIENIGSERFSIQWQMYERVMAIGATRQVLACVAELDKDEDVVAKWPGAGYFEAIRFKDVSLEEDQYHVQPYAVSGLVNTPGDRLSLASELWQSQLISPDAYLRIIQYKDIDAELGRTTTQSTLVEKYIEQWLDATKETQDDGSFRYRPPIRFMQHGEAILQVGRAYMEAELDGAPDFNLGFFLRFMADCDKQIQQQEARKAELAAAALGKGAVPPPMVGGAVPPGAPGMAMPGPAPVAA